jgi:hypothetical protein
MTGPEPKSAELIAADATTALPWQTVRDAQPTPVCTGSPPPIPTGRPHVPSWPYGPTACSTPHRRAAAQKGRNLSADPRCTITARTDASTTGNLHI